MIAPLLRRVLRRPSPSRDFVRGFLDAGPIDFTPDPETRAAIERAARRIREAKADS